MEKSFDEELQEMSPGEALYWATVACEKTPAMKCFNKASNAIKATIAATEGLEEEWRKLRCLKTVGVTSVEMTEIADRLNHRHNTTDFRFEL
jgi:hypothetical protein